MDRYSIIQKQLFDQVVTKEVNNCGEDQCVCADLNEKLLLKKRDLFQLVMIMIVALIAAFTMKTNRTVENMLSAKGTMILACSSQTNNSDDQVPADQKNQNNCSHQQLVGTISKRKHLKTFYK